MQNTQKVLERFDADGSGVLSRSEIHEALKILLGVEVPSAKLDAAMKKFDADESGSIDINEFGQLVSDLRVSRKKYVDPPLKLHEGSCLGQDKKLPGQDLVLRIYQHKLVCSFVALCIMGNFAMNVLEKEIDPDPENPKYKDVWAITDFTFNIIFLIELCANMWSFGGPVRKFWSSPWNVFDTIIVMVGVLTMVNVLGPPLDKLKLMRAFRVFRLFKRVESLNCIIVALVKSIPGVANAFVVMVVFFCIYAILAVELFRDFGIDGTYTTYDVTTGSTSTLEAKSGRGFKLGIEYYGTFMRALYTLFQVMTGESWSEAVARPLLFGWSKNNAIVVGTFFVSFIMLTQLVLINVVVAVLLEKFVAGDDGESDENAKLDARLANLDNKASSNDMNTKLDKIITDLSALADSVANLQAEMNSMRECSRKASKNATAQRNCNTVYGL